MGSQFGVAPAEILISPERCGLSLPERLTKKGRLEGTTVTTRETGE